MSPVPGQPSGNVEKSRCTSGPTFRLPGFRTHRNPKKRIARTPLSRGIDRVNDSAIDYGLATHTPAAMALARRYVGAGVVRMSLFAPVTPIFLHSPGGHASASLRVATRSGVGPANGCAGNPRDESRLDR